MRITNKETGEVFTQLDRFVLDAQKRYKRMMNVTYCDMECIAKHPKENTLFVLDECGNWEYFPNDLYEYVGVL